MIQILIVTFAIAIASAQDTNCYITKTDSNQPVPALTQCYRNNQDACCNSITDTQIGNVYASLLSHSCIRRFPFLEVYFCLACSPNQPLATFSQNNTVKVCRSFVQNIWGTDLNKSTTIFDSCGMISYWANSSLILPSVNWNNASQFINDVHPPFFENFTIQVVDDSETCFSYVNKLWNILTIYSALLIFVMIIV